MAWSEASGVSIHFYCSGSGRHSLVLVHELGGSLDGWDAIVPSLESDFRVLRYDQRGSGLSEKVRRVFTIDDHVRDLESVIRAAGLEPPYNIAGLAAGAGIALLFAHRHASEVGSVILCCPSISVNADRIRYLSERSELATREGMRAVVDSTLSRSFPEIAIHDRAAYDSYRARFLSNDPVSYGLANRVLAETDIESIVPSIDSRCLVLAGRHDSLRPPERVKALTDRLSRAEFAVIDSGHLMHVQAPKALGQHMRSFILRNRESDFTYEPRNVPRHAPSAVFAEKFSSLHSAGPPDFDTSLRVKANGIHFHCRVDGHVGAPWLVFCNSLATNLSLWDDQVAVFAKSFRIMRYDQRGHGATDAPASPCTFDLLAEDAAALLEVFGIQRAVFIGISMGAVTALVLAARHPERLSRVVASDGQWATPSGSVEVWEERIRLVQKDGMEALVEQTVSRWFQPDFLAAAPPVLQKVRAMIRSTPSEGYIANVRALQNYDLREEFSTISLPTLLIVGEKDGTLPNVIKEMNRAIPSSALVEIAGAGHLPNVEKPEAFNRAIEPFICGCVPSKADDG